MRRNYQLFRVLMVALGIALLLPVAITVTSRVASASGYMWASEEPCDPSPLNPECIASNGP